MKSYSVFVYVALLEVLIIVSLTSGRDLSHSFSELGHGNGNKKPVKAVPKPPPGPNAPVVSIQLDLAQKHGYRSNNNNVSVKKGISVGGDFEVYAHSVDGKRLKIENKVKDNTPIDANTNTIQVLVYFWHLEPTKPVMLQVFDDRGSYFLSLNKALQGGNHWSKDFVAFRHSTVGNELFERLDHRVCAQFKAAPVDITKTSRYLACGSSEVQVSSTPLKGGKYYKVSHVFSEGLKPSRISHNGLPTSIPFSKDVRAVYAYFPKEGMAKLTFSPLLVEVDDGKSHSWYEVADDKKTWKKKVVSESQLEQVLDSMYLKHHGAVIFDISLEPEKFVPTAMTDPATAGRFNGVTKKSKDNPNVAGITLTPKVGDHFRVSGYKNRQYTRVKGVMTQGAASIQTGLPIGALKSFTMYNCSGEAKACYIESTVQSETGWYHKIPTSHVWKKIELDIGNPDNILECRLMIPISLGGCGKPCPTVDISHTAPYSFDKAKVDVQKAESPDIFHTYVHTMKGVKSDGLTYKGNYLSLKGTKSFLPLVNASNVHVTVYFWKRNLAKPLLIEVSSGGSDKVWYENAGSDGNTVWNKITQPDLLNKLDHLNCLLNKAYVVDVLNTAKYLSNCNHIDVERKEDPYNHTSGYIRYTHTLGNAPFTVSKVTIKGTTQKGMDESMLDSVSKISVFYPRSSADHVLIYVEISKGNSSQGKWFRKETGIKSEL